MSSKIMITLGMMAGSLIGGYIPVLFGDSGFSFTSLFTSGIGAVIGIYVAYRLTR
jgi:uncharacterized membrane protein YeaQ/YmgE (transglycosylase-associated protein family)